MGGGVAGGAALGESGGSRAGASPQAIKRAARLMSPVVITIALTMALSTALILTLTQVTRGDQSVPGSARVKLAVGVPSGSRERTGNDAKRPHRTRTKTPSSRTRSWGRRRSEDPAQLPCQGGGRGFESRRPLAGGPGRALVRARVDLRSHLQLGRSGGVAEWLGKGLQNPLHRFNSGPRLGSAVPCRTSGA